MAVRPYVLITNDDGIVAPGIAALICALQPTCDLIAVAPDGPRSGASCSITTTTPLSYHTLNDEPGMQAFACSGTPMDCVKLGLHVLCKRRPDLIVSGVNLGNNATVNTHYSGTIGAVIEGCLKGIPSIGFSLDCADASLANYAICTEYIKRICEHVLKNGLPAQTYLNVNFPLVEEIKGMRVCRMSMGVWDKEFARIDSPRGGHHYWMTGTYSLTDKGKDHDMAALADGYVSIVPQTIDVTDRAAMEALSALDTEKKNKAEKAPAKRGRRKAADKAPKAETETATVEVATPKVEEKSKKAGRKQTKAKSKTAKGESQPAKVESKPVKAESKPARTEGKPAKAGRKQTEAEDKPAAAEPKARKTTGRKRKATKEQIAQS
ncbi:MAG: 5'/3'-nucleotidase SurE [Bacteroidaceae bacterium]|nr:5'/3'-nucleotidase SurE [Bacteroidaceae bacterium]